jgi:antirestriction protein ArdC
LENVFSTIAWRRANAASVPAVEWHRGSFINEPETYYGKPEITATPLERIAHAESFFTATKADVRYRGNSAYYSADGDYIQMPVMDAFRDAASFYAMLAHESTHWTKHPARLARDFGRKAWGDEGYAREELVAELASAFLCTDLGLTPEVREDHAAYIASWLKMLHNDKRAIFSAASCSTFRKRRARPISWATSRQQAATARCQACE